MTRQEPPDWALPSWDSLPDEGRIGARQGIARATHGPDGTAPPGPPSQAPAAAATSGAPAQAPGTFGLRILAVSDVTRAVREAVRNQEGLRDLWVEGEVGRVTVSSAGHAYFALKDERSQLQCVWFRDDRLRSAFEPQAGLRIVVHGRMDLFEPQGALQLYVESIQPAGFGDLALRFEALKARLAAEGLFDTARKRQLPPRPATIAVVTSPTGAVWRDICHVLSRRWPLARVVLVAAQVQGDAAPGSIVTALRRLERYRELCLADGRPADAPQVTILARGGGSLEDLWPFNDERVVRAVVAHAMPVVCGVGHEVDVTLADFAADVRAPTPSAAAEIVVPDQADFAASLRRAAVRLQAATGRQLETAARELQVERRALDRVSPIARLASAREQAGLLFERATRALADRLAADRRPLDRAREILPRLAAQRVAAARAALDASAAVLPRVAAHRLATARAALDASAAALAVLGPQATLDRGYAIVRSAGDEGILRDPADAPPGTDLRVRVARGELDARVTGPDAPDAPDPSDGTRDA